MDPTTPVQPAGAAVLTSDILRELRDYWLGLRGEGQVMPVLTAVDPVAIPGLLPYLVLADVSRDPLRFRYRLIGTKVTEMAGRDATGRWIDHDLYGDNTDRVLWAYRRCVETHAPVAVREPVQFVDKDWIVIEVLLMPLGRADDLVERILVGVHVVDHPKDAPLPDTRQELDWRA